MNWIQSDGKEGRVFDLSSLLVILTVFQSKTRQTSDPFGHHFRRFSTGILTEPFLVWKCVLAYFKLTKTAKLFDVIRHEHACTCEQSDVTRTIYFRPLVELLTVGVIFDI